MQDFKHVLSLVVLCQTVFLAIAVHCQSFLQPLSLLHATHKQSSVAPMECLTMLLLGYGQMGSWAFR